MEGKDISLIVGICPQLLKFLNKANKKEQKWREFRTNNVRLSGIINRVHFIITLSFSTSLQVISWKVPVPNITDQHITPLTGEI